MGPVPSPVDSEDGRFGSLGQRFLLKRLDPVSKYQVLPFDYYCPSVQDKLAKRICKNCGLYFSTAFAMNSHRKLHKILPTTTIDTIEDEEVQSLSTISNNRINENIYIIKNLKNWFNN